MGIQHNSNKFTLEKHKMTKKASNDLTSQRCLINRPIYSAGILNDEKIKPRAEIPCECFLSTHCSVCFGTRSSAPNPSWPRRTPHSRLKSTHPSEDMCQIGVVFG